MGNRLKNKIAIVTAAGQGIGKATAIAFYLSLIHISEPTRPY